MASPEIHQFICRSDNFGVLVRDPRTGVVAAIDAPDGAAVSAALKQKGWQLTHILTTHRHGDHVDGNLALKAETGCTIIGPRSDVQPVPGLDRVVAEPDTFTLGSLEVRVIATPGHTREHIVYHMPGPGLLFAGDTLFAMGCGRVFEGTPQEMWGALSKLAALPASTTIYCGHEYTLSNAKFALTIEPDNAKLKARAAQVEAQRQRGEMTLPTTMAIELETNPFLRANSPEIRKRLSLEGAADWQVFAEVRERKNRA